MPSPRLSKINDAADANGIGRQTVRNWVSSGLVPAYDPPMVPAALVDLDDIEREAARRPLLRRNLPSRRLSPDVPAIAPNAPLTFTPVEVQS